MSEMVKIVLGGFLGLAIGYGILLWGFKTDPFNLARYLPAAIVPDSVAAPDVRAKTEISRPSAWESAGLRRHEWAWIGSQRRFILPA